MIEVVTLTGPLTDTGKYRVTTVFGGNVADQFHHVDGLAHTGTTEQANLTAFGERADQVDNLDAGFQQLIGSCLIGIARRLAVNRHTLLLTNLAGFVDRATQHVHDPTQRLGAYRHRDGSTSIGDVQTTLEP